MMRPIKPKPVRKNCIFCKDGVGALNYKKFEELKTYLSERGKIIGRARSGICAKHQRMIAIQIKRARHLGTLQFKAGI